MFLVVHQDVQCSIVKAQRMTCWSLAFTEMQGCHFGTLSKFVNSVVSDLGVDGLTSPCLD